MWGSHSPREALTPCRTTDRQTDRRRWPGHWPRLHPGVEDIEEWEGVGLSRSRDTVDTKPQSSIFPGARIRQRLGVLDL